MSVSPPTSYIDRTLWDSASSSAERILVGKLGEGDSNEPLGSLRLPMTRPFDRISPFALFTFLPPINMLPLFENSTCPGKVKSSKLPVGISVNIPINGNFGMAGSSSSFSDLCGSWSFDASGLGEVVDAVSLCDEITGRLGEWLILGVDSTSVPNVVLLSLAVELDGARAESLLPSS